MSKNITCPACGLASLELWGVTECDDDEFPSLFCDEYYCPVCGEKFVGGIADYADDYDDDEYE
jgi:hypothetical protein